MKYYGIYQGIVVDNKDPKMLGRCRIKVPSVFGAISSEYYDILPWAIYISPNATGTNRTTFILPKINDVVWVFFIGGDKTVPAYFGSSFGIKNGIRETPLLEEEYFSTDVIYSSGDGAKLIKTDKELKLEFNDSSISITSSGDIEVTCKGKFTINGKQLNLE